MTNWKEYKLGEIGTIGRGKSKHRPRDASHLYGGKYPFIQTGDIKAANHKLFKYSQTYSEDGLKQSKLWPKGTICITIAANIADTAILTFPACFPDSVIGFVANEKLCNIDFIEYLLQYYRMQIKSHSIGSVQDNINLGTFEKIKFKLPDLPTQTAIAEILSSLDDKIELNNKINQELENLAQTLFKQWFIDFEFPVNCLNQDFQDEQMNRMIAEPNKSKNKAKSRKSLNQENQDSDNIRTYRSSGGEMVDSELGEIPKEWEVKTLKDEFNLNMGQSPKGDTYNDIGEGMIFFQGRSDFGFRFPSVRKYTSDPKKVAKKFETLISVRAPVGDINMAETECCIGRGLGSISHPKSFFSYTYYKMLSIQDELKSYDNEGTVFGSINKETLSNIKSIIPPLRIAEEYNNLIVDKDSLVYNLSCENQELTNLRDTLLPKLISGELEVNGLNLDLQDERIKRMKK